MSTKKNRKQKTDETPARKLSKADIDQLAGGCSQCGGIPWH